MIKLLILLSLMSCRAEELDKEIVLIHTYCRRLDPRVEIYECRYKDIKYLKDCSLGKEQCIDIRIYNID